MKKNLVITIFVILIFVNCSCNKPDKLYLIPDAAKHWAYFQKGSYWIYVNDSTVNTATPLYDSLYVSKASVKKFEESSATGPPEYAYERAEVEYFSKHYQNNPFVYFNADDDAINIDYSENNLLNTSIHCVLLAFDKNLNLVSYGKNNIHKAYYNQYEINGVVFNHVAQTEILSNGSKIADFYIAKQKWIVKKVFYFTGDTVSWSLCRQRIVQ